MAACFVPLLSVGSSQCMHSATVTNIKYIYTLSAKWTFFVFSFGPLTFWISDQGDVEIEHVAQTHIEPHKLIPHNYYDDDDMCQSQFIHDREQLTAQKKQLHLIVCDSGQEELFQIWENSSCNTTWIICRFELEDGTFEQKKLLHTQRWVISQVGRG